MGEDNSKWSNWQKINLENIQATHHQKNNPIKKWAKDLNRHFSKDDIQMDIKHVKKMLNIAYY